MSDWVGVVSNSAMGMLWGYYFFIYWRGSEVSRETVTNFLSLYIYIFLFIFLLSICSCRETCGKGGGILQNNQETPAVFANFLDKVRLKQQQVLFIIKNFY